MNNTVPEITTLTAAVSAVRAVPSKFPRKRQNANNCSLRKAISPMVNNGVDTIVLGCTHYPFTIPLINQITNNEVKVIDPSPAVARQTKRMFDRLALGELNITNQDNVFISSGPLQSFKTNLSTFIPDERLVCQALWENKKLLNN